MLRKLLVLLVWVGGAVSAQPGVSAPDVTIPGILQGPHGQRAIVVGPSMSFLVKPGDKLGDYTVEQIEADSVTFGFHKERFKVTMETGATSVHLSAAQMRPAGPSDTISLRLHKANLAYALKLLAKDGGQNLCFGSSVNGVVDLEVNKASLKGTMEVLAASAGQKIRLWRGYLLIADAATISQKEPSLAGLARAQRPITLDFYGADLVYVLKILAKEMKVSAIIGPKVSGTFTITAKSVPNGQTLALALWIQNRNLKATLDDHFLVVDSVIPPVASSPAGPGPLLTWETKIDSGTVPVAQLVEKVAALLHVKAVLPAQFSPNVNIGLERAPALQALERVLALHGYRYRLEKGNLMVERAPQR